MIRYYQTYSLAISSGLSFPIPCPPASLTLLLISNFYSTKSESLTVTTRRKFINFYQLINIIIFITSE